MNKNSRQRNRLSKTLPDSIGDGKFIVSVNKGRNMAQAIYVSKGEDGKKSSVTRHEALDPAKPFNPFKRKSFKRIDGAKIETQS